MCGIAGYFALAVPPLEGSGGDPLRLMQDALHHRGPDDQGIFRSGDAHFGLVATRLAILDLSAAGHQPMRSNDGRLVIVFNGEIYNFRQLRAEMEAQGESFHTGSDTEVVLRLYQLQGAAGVERLRGMFAFAIVDEAAGTGFLARDPLGIKPLYVHYDPASGRLLFASELRTLLKPGWIPKRIDPRALYGYFATGAVPEPRTMIQGVRCLPAGQWLSWQDGKTTDGVFWTLEFPPAPGSGLRAAVAGQPPATRAESVSLLRTALCRSVNSHFESDVPVSIFLSGGVDSTALLALAHASGREHLHTYSIGFAEAAFDEGKIAQRSAVRFGAKHSEWRLEPAAGRSLFEEFLSATDQPSVDGFNSFVISRFAHQHGEKVVLSGLGGDEVFGGYPSFKRVPQMLAWGRRLRVLGPLAAAAGWWLRHEGRTPTQRRIGDYLGGPPTLRRAYTSFRGIFTSENARSLVEHYTGERLPEGALDSPNDQLPDSRHYPTDGDAISALEVERYMRNQLLRDSDVMSMANSLELRVPFVDQGLFETVARIPATWRLEPGKRLLQDAVPEIPAWVSSRPKQGFSFPFESWLEGPWRDLFARDGNAAANVNASTWYQKWSLVVFERWWREIQ